MRFSTLTVASAVLFCLATAYHWAMPLTIILTVFLCIFLFFSCYMTAFHYAFSFSGGGKMGKK